jgi:hypothetical protein
MPRPLLLAGLLAGRLLLPGPAAAQSPPAPAIDTAQARRHFAQASALTSRDAGRLWGRSLGGPLLFVDPGTRSVLADSADFEARLHPLGGFFAATLPPAENVANTAFKWGGRTWAMVVWPPAEDSVRRAVLFVHELWHRIQDSLGLPATNPANPHLATRDGRLWLRLEGRALQRALETSGAARTRALRDAVLFRRRRLSRFPGADSTERQLELHEGLAEYTGVVLAAPDSAALRTLVAERLAVLDTAAHFERDFAYRTGPAYGFFLDLLAPYWRATLRRSDDLPRLLNLALHPRAPAVTQAVSRGAGYGYAALRREEIARETRTVAHLAELRARFVAGPVLELPLSAMKLGFDPALVEAFDTLGTVYGKLRLSDEWGVLECDASGGLISSDWHRIVVPAPADTAGRRLTGPGWVLELAPAWRIVPGSRRGDWTVAAQ